MASLSTNLKTLMGLAKINASELARRTGVAQPIIHRLSTGQNLNPKLATVKPISEYFMVTVSQLIGEEALPSDKSFYRVSSEHRGWNRVPLISWHDAVHWPNTQNQYQNAENALYISTDANVSKLAYGLKVRGCAMEPIFPEGTTIIVEPNRQPKDRDFVVVHFSADTESRLKQVIIDGSDYYLKSLNPDLNEVKVVRMQPQDRFLGIMAQAKVDY
ncbi:MAG: transcriptional regulator [Coxiella sp. RIFCSPHIGHO2_12_FULL_44_14]|nr:MAG: transcriptional regulator [Coxiella sp. RIFCSPHIGHO2_12_FULL_44_14]